MQTKPDPRRRQLLVWMAAVGVGYMAFNQAGRFWRPELAFEQAVIPGFRRLSGSGESNGLDPLTMVRAASPGVPSPWMARIAHEPCSFLFNDAQPDVDSVRIAYFTDANCPYCRLLSSRLKTINARADVNVIRHELPLLGKGSIQAARATLAGGLQGRGDAFHEAIINTRFKANDTYIADLSNRLGLDTAQLFADMGSDAVLNEIDRNYAIANYFGFRGTPVMVIERTIVTGAIDDDVLDAIIDLERAANSCI